MSKVGHENKIGYPRYGEKIAGNFNAFLSSAFSVHVNSREVLLFYYNNEFFFDIVFSIELF